MATFKNDREFQAYQIAENTPASRHSYGCNSMGVGALVSASTFTRLCNCSILDRAKSIQDSEVFDENGNWRE